MKRLLFLTLITLVSCEDKNSADVNQSSITTNPVYEYNGLSYNYIELNSPPFDGTIWITGDIITVNEPSVFLNVIFQGKSARTMYDREWGGLPNTLLFLMLVTLIILKLKFRLIQNSHMKSL